MSAESRPFLGLPHWVVLFNALPEGQPVSAREVFEAERHWWPKSQGQLAHALRKMAAWGLVAKPGRGQYVRREGSIAFDSGAVHLSLAHLAGDRTSPSPETTPPGGSDA